jgi:hypothetical protein
MTKGQRAMAVAMTRELSGMPDICPPTQRHFINSPAIPW